VAGGRGYAVICRRVLALLLVPALAACSAGRDQPAAPTSSRATVPGPVSGKFTGFVTPCPAGTQTKFTDLYISTVVDCAYGDRTKFPKFTSTATINKPLESQGSPAAAAEALFRGQKAAAQGHTAEGVTVEDRPGLGDEAFLLVSYPGNSTVLLVRSANVLIQAGAQVDADGDRAQEVAALKALEPQVTELAEGLLAQLK